MADIVQNKFVPGHNPGVITAFHTLDTSHQQILIIVDQEILNLINTQTKAHFQSLHDEHGRTFSFQKIINLLRVLGHTRSTL